jgi:TDG/mug DNA glycosylase family protein
VTTAPPPDAEQLVPDLVRPGLSVLFCGINPGCTSARLHQHFARRGNRFWPALHRSGFTPRQLEPAEQEDLLDLGLGVTNLASRASATAADLAREELVAGGARLVRIAQAYRPRVVAVVGVTAYRAAFGRPRAVVGPQPDPIGPSLAWVLPNPSGLNAHYQLDDLVREFAGLRCLVVDLTGGSDSLPAVARRSPSR